MSRAARLLVSLTSFIALGLLPAIAVTVIFVNVVRGGLVTDFENVFYVAAHAIADGENPFPSPDDDVVELGRAYVYPPLTALAALPATLLSSEAAGLLVMALLCIAVVATLLVLEVRDWRCYGMAFLWLPVISAVQTGNITILLGLGAALTWRFHRDAARAGLALGLSLAAKLILWPLALWLLVATRRLRPVVYTLTVFIAAVALSWAVIGFAGLADYPALLDRVQELEKSQGYTLYALALDLGVPENGATALWATLAVALLTAVVVVARRGDHERAFVLAIAGALACSPIVWLHYFALLLVAVAVAQPKLGPAWFVPLLMYGSTGTFNGTTLQTLLTIFAAGMTVAAALWFTAAPRRSLGLDTPLVMPSLRESQ